MLSLLHRWTGRPQRGDTPAAWRFVHSVRALEREFRALADEGLAQQLQGLRSQAAPHPTGDAALARAFALCVEAIRRTTGKELYDVQLLAGLALSRGAIAQMQTGEGKTLTTALPVVWSSLDRGGVHVATTNTYLAQRDFTELRPAFELLGLTVGLLPPDHREEAKRQAYAQDVTFGPGYEFGFDYLRDQLTLRRRPPLRLGEKYLRQLSGVPTEPPQFLQRGHAMTIVDEADSVLIDEALMPLILSGRASAVVDRAVYEMAQGTAAGLREERDYVLDVASGRIEFTTAGWERLHAPLQGHPRLPLRRPWAVYVENAVRGRLLLRRNVDYVVRDGRIAIVDQHTGRIHVERTWRDGLHQAIEFQEGLEVTPETASDARITRQRYFRLYDRRAGLTATAEEVEAELREFYGLATLIIPTHRPCRRIQRPLRCFGTAEQRDAAVVAEVAEEQRRGRPVLVGTRTIRHSQTLATRLQAAGIEHVVLNGVQDEQEAQIIARAGQSGTVTIATNMAGRGTDIRLDARALEAGGLHVIGVEPNLVARIDRQLAGRAARQGEPGSCRFFAASEDELFLHATRLGEQLRRTAGAGEASQDFSREIREAQRTVEAANSERRRQLAARDEWLDDVLKQLVGTT